MNPWPGADPRPWSQSGDPIGAGRDTLPAYLLATSRQDPAPAMLLTVTVLAPSSTVTLVCGTHLGERCSL